MSRRKLLPCGMFVSACRYCAFQNHADSEMHFSLPSIKCSAAPLSFRLCCLNCARRFDLIIALGSSQKLEGVAGHLIDGSENRICRLSVEF